MNKKTKKIKLLLIMTKSLQHILSILIRSKLKIRNKISQLETCLNNLVQSKKLLFQTTKSKKHYKRDCLERDKNK
jgi:hypothetical protein